MSSKLGMMILNNPLCNTPDMKKFLETIESHFISLPENARQVLDNDLVTVFEKGLVLGLHHFNTDIIGNDETEE